MNDSSPSQQDKFRRYRARKKAQGLREIRMWIWDIESPAFKAQLQRESEILRDAPEQNEATDFIEAVMVDTLKDID